MKEYVEVDQVLGLLEVVFSEHQEAAARLHKFLQTCTDINLRLAAQAAFENEIKYSKMLKTVGNRLLLDSVCSIGEKETV